MLTCDSHRTIRWTFPISTATARCSVNLVQTAAKWCTQHGSARCCSKQLRSLLQKTGRASAEPDGTRAETTFRLSPKRTSPFKSAGESVQLTAEVCAAALVMLDTPRPEVVWEYWLPTPFASFPFTSPPVRHRVPPHSESSILRTAYRLSLIWRNATKNYLNSHTPNAQFVLTFKFWIVKSNKIFTEIKLI